MTSAAPNLEKSGLVHLIIVSETNWPLQLASFFPSVKRTLIIGDSMKRSPCRITGVPPVSGPVSGSVFMMAYGGPTTPATLRIHRSSSHFCFQPPKKTRLHCDGSYPMPQSSRGGGGAPCIVYGVHSIVPASMMLTVFENSRGEVCPPKKKMRSVGTLSMLRAMWFHSVVGSLDQVMGSSSSGLKPSGCCHSIFFVSSTKTSLWKPGFLPCDQPRPPERMMREPATHAQWSERGEGGTPFCSGTCARERGGW